MRGCGSFAGLGLLGLAGLTGCFSSVRSVPKVEMQAPSAYKTADVGALEKEIADRAGAVHTLRADVMVTASTGGVKTGQVKTYTAFQGYIFVEKPADLRFILKLPVLGSKALDMVSDGKTFTLLIPPKGRAITGSNEVTKPSKNGLENLRPAVFLDSLLIPAVGPDEDVALTESTHVLEEAHGHHGAVEEPDYDLEIFRVRDGNLLFKNRIVHFDRTTLLPFQQDIYDEEGQIVTQASYENYKDAGPESFPMLVTIKRPLDQLELKIVITKLVMNQGFDSDQFELQIPPSIRVERLP